MLPFTLPDSPSYLVALSGGADSRLLLELSVRALLEREPDGKLAGRITAVHLHHGIRGEEADRDEAFCRAVCEGLGVPLTVGRADIPALAAASGESVETVGRRERYKLFRRVMTERHIPVLLTAHHADDNLETVLERLLRGSGTKGMGGIPPSRELGQAPDGLTLTVYRPLLSWTKKEILTACGELGLDYVTDSTNLEDGPTRNRLRHTVIPALEAVAGEDIPQHAAARLTRTAREDEDALNAIARERYQRCGGYAGSIPVTALNAEMPAIAKRMILCAYRDLTGGALFPDATLSAYHLDALLTLCREGQEGDLSDELPRALRGTLRKGCLVLIRPETPPPPPLPHELRPLFEGDTVWAEGDGSLPEVTVRVEVGKAPLPPLTGGDVFASAVFPADLLPLPLYARPRRQGDLILSHGMTKKLKKLLCDKHIPPHLRDRIPLICLPEGTPDGSPDGSPLWYPAAAFRDGYPAPAEGPCLRVTVFVSANRTSLEN